MDNQDSRGLGLVCVRLRHARPPTSTSSFALALRRCLITIVHHARLTSARIQMTSSLSRLTALSRRKLRSCAIQLSGAPVAAMWRSSRSAKPWLRRVCLCNRPGSWLPPWSVLRSTCTASLHERQIRRTASSELAPSRPCNACLTTAWLTHTL